MHLKNVKIADAHKKVGENGTEMGSKMGGLLSPYFPDFFEGRALLKRSAKMVCKIVTEEIRWLFYLYS